MKEEILLYHFNLDIDSCGEFEMGEAVDGFICRRNYIYQSFMDADFEVISRIFVDEGAFIDGIDAAVSRKRHWAHDLGTRPDGGIQNLLAACVNDACIVAF